MSRSIRGEFGSIEAGPIFCNGWARHPLSGKISAKHARAPANFTMPRMPLLFQLVKHGWTRGFSFACSSLAKYQRLDFGKKNYINSLLHSDLQSTSSMIVQQASLCSILHSTFSEELQSLRWICRISWHLSTWQSSKMCSAAWVSPSRAGNRFVPIPISNYLANWCKVPILPIFCQNSSCCHKHFSLLEVDTCHFMLLKSRTVHLWIGQSKHLLSSCSAL
jgi:hypothetical protein